MFIELLKYENIANTADRMGLRKVANAADTKIDRISKFIGNLYKLDLSEYDKQRLLLSKSFLEDFRKFAAWDDDVDDYESRQGFEGGYGGGLFDSTDDEDDTYGEEELVESPKSNRRKGRVRKNEALMEVIDSCPLLEDGIVPTDKYNRYYLPLMAHDPANVASALREEWPPTSITEEDDEVMFDLFRIVAGEKPKTISTEDGLSVQPKEALEILEYFTHSYGADQFPGMVFPAFANVVKRSVQDEETGERVTGDLYIDQLSPSLAYTEYQGRTWPMVKKLYDSSFISMLSNKAGKTVDTDSAMRSVETFPQRNEKVLDKIIENGNFSDLLGRIIMPAVKTSTMDATFEKIEYEEVPYLQRSLFPGGADLARMLAKELNVILAQNGGDEKAAAAELERRWRFDDFDRSPFKGKKSRISKMTWFNVGTVKRNALEAAVKSARNRPDGNPILADRRISFDKMVEIYESMGMLDRFLNYKRQIQKNRTSGGKTSEFAARQRGVMADARKAAKAAVDAQKSEDKKTMEDDEIEARRHIYDSLYRQVLMREFNERSGELYHTDDFKKFMKEKAKVFAGTKIAIKQVDDDSGAAGELGIIPDADSATRRSNDSRQMTITAMFNIMANTPGVYNSETGEVDVDRAAQAVSEACDIGETLVGALPEFTRLRVTDSVQRQESKSGNEGEYRDELADATGLDAFEQSAGEEERKETHSTERSGIDALVASGFFDEVVKAIMVQMGDSHQIGRNLTIADIGRHGPRNAEQRKIFDAFKNAVKKHSTFYGDILSGVFSEDDSAGNTARIQQETSKWTTGSTFRVTNPDGTSELVRSEALFKKWLDTEFSVEEDDIDLSSVDYDSLIEDENEGKYSISLIDRARSLGVDPAEMDLKRMEELIGGSDETAGQYWSKMYMKQIILDPEVDARVVQYEMANRGRKTEGPRSEAIPSLGDISSVRNPHPNLASYRTGRMAAYLVHVCGLPMNVAGLMLMENRTNLVNKVKIYFDCLRYFGSDKMGSEGDSPEESAAMFDEYLRQSEESSERGKGIQLLSNAPGQNDIDIAMFLASQQMDETSAGVKTHLRRRGFSENRMKAFFLMRMAQFLNAFRNEVFLRADALSDDMLKFNTEGGTTERYFGESPRGSKSKVDQMFDGYIQKLRGAIGVWMQWYKQADPNGQMSEEEQNKKYSEILDEIRDDFEKECAEILSLFIENKKKVRESGEMLQKKYIARGYKPPQVVTPENAISIFNKFKKYIVSRYGGEAGEDIDIGLSNEDAESYTKLILGEITDIPEEKGAEFEPILPAIHEKIERFCQEYAAQYENIDYYNYQGCSDVLDSFYKRMESKTDTVEPDVDKDVEIEVEKEEPVTRRSVEPPAAPEGFDESQWRQVNPEELQQMDREKRLMRVIEILNSRDSMYQENEFKIYHGSPIFRELTENLGFTTNGDITSPTGSLRPIPLPEGAPPEQQTYMIVSFPAKARSAGSNLFARQIEAMSMSDIEVELILRKYGF